MLYVECEYVRVHVPSKHQAHKKSTPRISIFTHCKRPVHWASTRMWKMRVFEGLWLSVNGRLPGNYKQVYTQSCMSMTSTQNVGQSHLHDTAAYIMLD